MRVPSKTFLIGEYLALKGGPSLVVATTPFFEARPVSELPKGSPADRFCQKQGPSNSVQRFAVNQPHPRQGGFGASTAEFLLCYQSQHPQFSAHDLMKAYQDSCEGAASGADLMAQAFGGVSLWDRGEHSSQVWPFEDLAWSLFQTQVKIATHEHLKEIQLDEKTVSVLRPLAEKAVKALSQRHSEAFLVASCSYSEALRDRGWVAESTLELEKTLNAHASVRHARGCGALGADVICIFHNPSEFQVIKKLAETVNIDFIADSRDLVLPIHQERHHAPVV